MKLHAIEVDHLNSLYGTQSVDLDAAFGGASLFLIHGATGAGKSTLMDAVSLALFGETPRLDAQRGAEEADPRHVMSHGAGSCHAQIEFSKLERDGTRRRYRARWACRRARENPEGRWQDPQRSLERRAPDGSWTLLVASAKRKDFQPVFDEVLEGFSVQDFKRSMLLAQGQFDALLDASAEARASILERLTDTRDYKRWGQRAAALRRAHERRLADLEARLDGHELVDPAVVQRLEAETRAREQEAVQGQARLEALRAALDARRRVDDLVAERATLQKRQHELGITEPALRRERDAAAGRRARTQARLRRATRALEQARPAVETAIDAASRLEHAQQRAREAADAVDGAGKASDTAQAQLGEASTLHETASKELAAAVAARDAHPPLQRLVEDWPALRRDLDALIHEWRALDRARGRWTERGAEIEAEAAEQARARAQLEADRARMLGPLERAAAQARARVDQGRGDLERRAHLEQLRARELSAREGLARLETVGVELDGLEGEISRLDAALARLERDREGRAPLARRCEDLARARARAKSELEARQRAHERLARVADLAEHRALLVPGEACPLCGSEAHPYGHGPGAIEPEGELAASREELRVARSELDGLQRAHDEAREILAQVDGQLASGRRAAGDEHRRLRSRLDALTSTAAPGDEAARDEASPLDTVELGALASAARRDWAASRTAAQAELTRADAERAQFEAAVAALEDATAALDAERARLERTAAGVAERDARLQARRARQADERDELEATRRTLDPETQAVAADLRDRGVLDDAPTPRDLAAVDVTDAPAREAGDRADALGRWVEALDAATRAQRGRMVAVEAAERRATEAALQRQSRETAAAAARRAHETAAATLEASNRAEAEARRRFEQAMAQLPAPTDHGLDDAEAAADPRRHLGLLRAQVEALRCDLDEASLHEHGVAARVLELEARAGELRDSLAALADRQREAQQTARATVAALGQADPPRSRPELEAALETARAEAEAAQTRHRETHAQWRLLESQRARHRALTETLTEARRAAAPWIALHQLIGRRDGDAFKTFAQALNLARLIERANVHLGRLSERYRLAQVHEAGVPTLEFAVEDLFHLRRARSTRSLSGGERFLVSLALALGLSDLRTVRMPIDTLLLDEGFGTLDPETLSVALGALSQLRASGRQVGIISHVVGLRDRIEAQLRVETIGDGRSRLRVASSAGEASAEALLALDPSAAE